MSNGKSFLIILSIIGSLFSGVAQAYSGPKIYCNGMDMYGDEQWTVNVYVRGNTATHFYTEQTGFGDPQTTKVINNISNGRINIPCPGMLTKAFFNLKTNTLEFYSYETLKPIQNPFDVFECKVFLRPKRQR